MVPSAIPPRFMGVVKTSKGNVQGGRTTSQKRDAKVIPKINIEIGSRVLPIFSLIKK